MAEGIELVPSSSNKSGYKGVHQWRRATKATTTPGNKGYSVNVKRNGKKVTLGYFVTREEAALCYAKSPEGKAAVARAAAARAGSSSGYISR